MNKQRRIYVVGRANEYVKWMEPTGMAYSIEEADLVCFTGGEDLWPSLYGKKAHPTTSFNKYRDIAEREEFLKAVALKKPMIGVCRGSQFICVMAGGLLVQHQSHPMRHWIFTTTHGDIHVTSTHHQRQFPFNLKPDKYKLLGWCNLSPFSLGEHDDDDMMRWDNGVAIQECDLPEVEVAYYTKINALAIQSHPEYCYPPSNERESDYIGYCRAMLNGLMDGTL